MKRIIAYLWGAEKLHRSMETKTLSFKNLKRPNWVFFSDGKSADWRAFSINFHLLSFSKPFPNPHVTFWALGEIIFFKLIMSKPIRKPLNGASRWWRSRSEMINYEAFIGGHLTVHHCHRVVSIQKGRESDGWVIKLIFRYQLN